MNDKDLAAAARRADGAPARSTAAERNKRDPKAKARIGAWAWPALVIEMGGVRFEVTASGTVYERTFAKPSGNRVAHGRRRGEKVEPGGTVPGPLRKVKDFTRAEAVREVVRRSAADATQRDEAVAAFLAAHGPKGEA